MIEQQINLYQDRFREKMIWFSAVQVLAGLALLVVVGGIWSYLLHAELSAVEQANRDIRVQRDRLTADLASANAELARLLEDDSVEREIAGTAKQVNARKQVLNFVEANRFGSGDGFSGYLVALSRLHVDDIWLNRVSLGQDYVRIEGSSLRADSVPAYFDSFGSEEVFVGNRFDLFRVSRPADSEWKVDFEIATRGEDDG
ncbi:MAG: hypothetical protein QNJ85_11460 [Gammaproteobacteria bacterium]|nr:hypothetical protein [Gammaproteobacteria bacterium]